LEINTINLKINYKLERWNFTQLVQIFKEFTTGIATNEFESNRKMIMSDGNHLIRYLKDKDIIYYLRRKVREQVLFFFYTWFN